MFQWESVHRTGLSTYKHYVSMHYYDYKDIDHYPFYQEASYVLVSDEGIDS